MARAPKPAADEEAESPSLIASEQITYRPIHDGDPAKVTWMGLVFHANVPKTITNPKLIDAAKGNKWFKVGEFDPKTDGVPVEETGLPKTPEQYRAHVIAWLKRMESVDALDTKWAGEETLRIECGVGTDDIEYLAGFVDPARHELRKRDRAA